MREKLPARRRQVSLFPERRGEEEGSVDDPKPELVDALADLLLEALGDDGNVEGGGRESEDNA
ncbi:MAG TPA: hypothetical protein VFL83_08795 [Anaeromyxobacter sp.]|nr:hypothetical protein [Anaeromyxobacter sp.]